MTQFKTKTYKNAPVIYKIRKPRYYYQDICFSGKEHEIKNVEIKHGVGTYYYHDQAKPLAQNIQKHLLHQTKFKDDGVNYASFALTRPTMPVSVLIECGYLICEYEAKCLANKKFQKRVAKAIARGTAQYLKDNF
jgi:N-acetylmuramoyl-L-alanine amidase